MGEYYLYCRKCNSCGSFDNVNRDCGKCCGTGKDWKSESFAERTIVRNGKRYFGTDEVFYEANPPTVNMFGDSIS